MDARKITYSIGWTTCSGAGKPRVVLDPGDGDGPIHVYTWNNVGPGCPAPLYHNVHREIGDVPLAANEDSVLEILRDNEDTIREVAALYLGAEWDGHNHVGRWRDREEARRRDEPAEWDYDRGPLQDALDAVRTEWDARECFAGVEADVIEAAIRAGSIEAAADHESTAAALEDVLLDDAEGAIRTLCEGRLDALRKEEDLDADDRAQAFALAALLGVEPGLRTYWTPDDLVEVGERGTDAHDTGRVASARIEPDGREIVTVGWDSGVSTEIDADAGTSDTGLRGITSDERDAIRFGVVS